MRRLLIIHLSVLIKGGVLTLGGSLLYRLHLIFIHVCIDSSQTVLEHHRSFALFMSVFDIIKYTYIYMYTMITDILG